MRLILSIIAALIIYGSLYPFDFSWHVASWREILLLDTLHHRAGRTDIVGNILLFIPYGFIGLIYHQRYLWRRALLIFSSGLFLAVVLQILQVYLPSRDAALGDAMYNAIGLLSGIALAWLLRGLPLQRWLDWNAQTTIAICLIICWLLYRWFPLVPSLDMTNLKNSLQPLWLDPTLHGHLVLHDSVAWLLCFFLARLVSPNRLSFTVPLGLLLTNFTAELILVNNTLSWDNLVGAMLAFALFPFLLRLHGLDRILLLSGVVMLWVHGLSPFVWKAEMGHFNWLPFRGFLHGALWSNTSALLEKMFLYGSLLYLLRGMSNWYRATLSLLLVLAPLEVAQLFVHNQNAEITDLILVLLITFTLASLERVFQVRGDEVR